MTMPSFRLAFRGYDPREVDRYAYHVEAEIEAAAAAHQDLVANVRSLSDQLDRAQEELVTLRRRPAVDDVISFRHLGPRVEQILAEAHAEADSIRLAATDNAVVEREASEAHIRAVEAAHARVVAGYEERARQLLAEEALVTGRLAAEVERLTVRVRTRAAAASRAEEYRARVRADAEKLLAAAQEQHHRVVESALAESERVQLHARTLARAIIEQAERDAAALLDQADRAATAQPQPGDDHPQISEKDRTATGQGRRSPEARAGINRPVLPSRTADESTTASAPRR
jgi:cell division septum initiation protein DivIVA